MTCPTLTALWCLESTSSIIAGLCLASFFVGRFSARDNRLQHRLWAGGCFRFRLDCEEAMPQRVAASRRDPRRDEILKAPAPYRNDLIKAAIL